MSIYRTLLIALGILIFLNAAYGISRLYLFGYSSGEEEHSDFTKTNEWLEKEDDIEKLREFAYVDHKLSIAREERISGYNQKLIHLAVFNALYLVSILVIIVRAMISNKALQTDAAKPRR